MKNVIVTGTTGMDGSIMSDYLLKNTKYDIYGGVRRLSNNNWKNIEHLKDNSRFKTVPFDLNDPFNVEKVVKELQPKYIFHFAANSFVGTSWDMPVQHLLTNTLGSLYILEAVRKHSQHSRVYFASSSETLGDVVYTPQDENHPIRPRSPYACSKAAMKHFVKVYRESYGLHVIAGCLFNHEFKNRGTEFVTRKITKEIARIKNHLENNHPVITPLKLGNLDAKRDWSNAEDFIDGVWRMLNQEQYNPALKDVKEEDLPKHIKEYVLASGETHSVKEFASLALKYANIEGRWIGAGLEEKFIDCKGRVIIEISPEFFRPAEVNLLCGDSTLARKELGWQPKTSFEELVKLMVDHDIKEFSKLS